MKKFIAIIVLICLFVTAFTACREDHYAFYETRDFSDYSPSFDFFPDSVGNSAVLSFGDTSYNYWSNSRDEFLVLKFNSTDEFSAEIQRINELKTQYDYLEKENYLVDGYDCVFFMCSFSTGRDEGIDKYILATACESFYIVHWDLVMICETDMTVVYNMLNYDTRNFEKWDERQAYIAEYFGLNLEEIARNIDQ